MTDEKWKSLMKVDKNTKFIAINLILLKKSLGLRLENFLEVWEDTTHISLKIVA